MTPDERRAYVRSVAERSDDLFQWGQKHDHVADDGSAACGDADVQLLLRIYGKAVPTIDDIRAAAGFPERGQSIGDGLLTHQILKALAHFGVPYRPIDIPGGSVRGVMHELAQLARHTGPVLFLCAYSSWPEKQGAVYYGVHADGRPNGYAHPLGQAGKDQLTGFTGGHYGILLSSQYHPAARMDSFDVRDPNHGSPARPFKPAYDRLTATQVMYLLQSFSILANNNLPWAAVPVHGLRRTS